MWNSDGETCAGCGKQGSTMVMVDDKWYHFGCKPTKVFMKHRIKSLDGKEYLLITSAIGRSLNTTELNQFSYLTHLLDTLENKTDEVNHSCKTRLIARRDSIGTLDGREPYE